MDGQENAEYQNSRITKPHETSFEFYFCSLETLETTMYLRGTRGWLALPPMKDSLKLAKVLNMFIQEDMVYIHILKSAWNVSVILWRAGRHAEIVAKSLLPWQALQMSCLGWFAQFSSSLSRPGSVIVVSLLRRGCSNRWNIQAGLLNAITKLPNEITPSFLKHHISTKKDMYKPFYWPCNFGSILKHFKALFNHISAKKDMIMPLY
jgi:hypothetical protein